MRPKGRKKIEYWLIKNQTIINISGLENECGIPRGRIQKFIKYGSKLRDSEIEALENHIKNIC
ncbi:hypothetical protein [Aquimarina macrocephali]|uniref:hypothetical protein n=1 Tax=Aquimarina macrocephali TaxID=666563 RepID=UPI0004BA603D|nr:hypothetical protein [Aquimarina macrocephali]